MNLLEKIKHLRIINSFNMYGPYCEDIEKNADIVLSVAIHDFINKYNFEIKNHYTFILKYDNEIYSFLAYKVIKNAAIVIHKDIDIRVLGDIKLPEEKEYFKEINSIGLKKAKKHKKAVLITGFNPICNVDCIDNFSNDFIEIYNPIEKMTPETLKTLQNFYLNEDSPLYCFNMTEGSIQKRCWECYFTYPIATNLYNSEELYDLSNNNDDKSIVIFQLNGTEKDFNLYDFIIESSKEGNIHLYSIPEDKIDFVKTNLSPYLDFRNQINHINVIDKKEISYFRSIITVEDKKDFTNGYIGTYNTNPVFKFSYIDFIGGRGSCKQ